MNGSEDWPESIVKNEKTEKVDEQDKVIAAKLYSDLAADYDINDGTYMDYLAT